MQYTLTFCYKLSRKTFSRLLDCWKRHQLAHTVTENMSYTPILARASRSESSTLSSFVTNLAENLFGMMACWTQLTTPSWRRLPEIQIWKQYTLTFCHKLSRNIYWWFCSQCMEKTRTCSYHAEKTCFCVTAYRGTYLQTLMETNESKLYTKHECKTTVHPGMAAICVPAHAGIAARSTALALEIYKNNMLTCSTFPPSSRALFFKTW